MIHQLTLGVGLKDEATFANYYPGQNGPLIHELKKAAAGTGERVIYFAGVGARDARIYCRHHAMKQTIINSRWFTFP